MSDRRHTLRKPTRTGNLLPQSTPSAHGPGKPPLTLDEINSIRFSVSKPTGYYFPQVDMFVDGVKVTLAHHEKENFDLRTQLHDISEELVDEQSRSASLQMQVELFRVQGDTVATADGGILTESQVGTVDAATQVELADLRAKVEHAEVAAAAHQARADAAEAYVAEYVAYATPLEERAQAAEARVLELEALVSQPLNETSVVVEQEPPSAIAEPVAEAPTVEEPEVEADHEDPVEPEESWKPTPLATGVSAVPSPPRSHDTFESEEVVARVAIPSPVTQVTKDSPVSAPTSPVFAHADEPDFGGAVEEPAYVTFEEEPTHAAPGLVTMVPIDSELPPGAKVPPRGSQVQTFQYNEAEPGEPIPKADGVPESEWAPELDPNRQF